MPLNVETKRISIPMNYYLENEPRLRPEYLDSFPFITTKFGCKR